MGLASVGVGCAPWLYPNLLGESSLLIRPRRKLLFKVRFWFHDLFEEVNHMYHIGIDVAKHHHDAVGLDDTGRVVLPLSASPTRAPGCSN